MAVPETRARRVRGADTDMGSIMERFGGGDIVAAILGMFVALGVMVFLGTLIAAGEGSIGYQLNAIDVDGNLQDIEVVASVIAVAVVLVSFFVGGWAAGRISRYDGGVNGIGAALVFILLVAIFGALGIFVGAEFNAFANADLPNWFSQIGGEDITVKSIAFAAAGIIAALLGGYAGGEIGEKYHRRVDAALVQAAESH